MEVLCGGLLVDPLEGLCAEAEAVEFGVEVEFVEEGGVVGVVGFPGEVSGVVILVVDDGVLDVAFAYFLAEEVEGVEGVEHVVDLLDADDVGVDEGPDLFGEGLDAWEVFDGDGLDGGWC